MGLGTIEKLKPVTSSRRSTLTQHTLHLQTYHTCNARRKGCLGIGITLLSMILSPSPNPFGWTDARCSRVGLGILLDYYYTPKVAIMKKELRFLLSNRNSRFSLSLSRSMVAQQKEEWARSLFALRDLQKQLPAISYSLAPPISLHVIEKLKLGDTAWLECLIWHQYVHIEETKHAS
jgi:hypothetical protein